MTLKAVGSEENTESRIRAAALYLFSTKGFEATGIRDVARDSGVSTAALYHYMGTKSDLLFRLIRDGMILLIDIARESMKDSKSASDEIVALLTSHVLFHSQEPLLAQVIDTQYSSLNEERRAEVQSMRDEYESLWMDAVMRGLDSGEFDVPEPSLARLAVLEIGNGVVRWYRPNGRLSALQIASELSWLALRLLGQRESSSATRRPGWARSPKSRESPE